MKYRNFRISLLWLVSVPRLDFINY